MLGLIVSATSSYLAKFYSPSVFSGGSADLRIQELYRSNNVSAPAPLVKTFSDFLLLPSS